VWIGQGIFLLKWGGGWFSSGRWGFFGWVCCLGGVWRFCLRVSSGMRRANVSEVVLGGVAVIIGAL